MLYVPRPHDIHAFDHAVNHPYCGLFLDMGLGKTAIVLTVINRLMYQEAEVNRVLVVAPKRVALTVWKQEAANWDHLNHLKFSIVWGTQKERVAALKKKADIYVINRENLAWLVARLGGKFPFPMVILDESSSFKDHRSQRFKAMKLVRPQVKRLIELSGTPAPNSLMDLWSQIYLLDQGARLGKTVTGFREKYFTPDKREGHIVFSYVLKNDAKQVIYNKIGDICISMTKEDYLDLPPSIENEIYLELPDEIQAQYDKFEEDSIMELVDKEVTAANAAALTNKLLQFANGAIYYEDKKWQLIHDVKMEALEEVLEELAGNPVIVLYTYRHDLERIMAKYPKARMLNTEKDIKDWNAGKIEIAVGHPASMGHGLNLQFGGNNLIFFGLNWSLELFLQVRDRLVRPGQTKPVYMHRLIMKKTMDVDVKNALRKKAAGQNALLEAIKSRIEKYTKSMSASART